MSVYFWHSINLVPTFSAVTVISDGEPYNVIGRLYEATIFGIVFTITLPSKKPRRAWSTELHGPIYSRRRKKWWWAGKEEHSD